MYQTVEQYATTAATVMDSQSSHYELRKKQALQSSKLAIDGYMLVTSSRLVPAQVCTKRPLDLSFCSVYDKYVEKKSKKWYMHSFLFKIMIAYWVSTTCSNVMNYQSHRYMLDTNIKVMT